MSAKTRIVLGVVAAGLLITPPLARASESITSFEVTTSTTAAGGHPDLTTTFALDSPGAPESAKNIGVELPEGLFGNPNAISRCSSSEFALSECAITSQAGLVTTYANVGGDPNHLLGTAPLYNMEPQTADEAARFAFVAPTVDIPVTIPIAVRTGSDFGLRMTVSGITQQIPLAAARLAVWGFPADGVHDFDRFDKGSPGSPPGCPGVPDARCAIPHYAPIEVLPLTDNPSACTGEPLQVSLSVTTYQDPEHLSEANASYPPTTRCDQPTFNPVLNLGLTTSESDSAAGMDLQMKAPLFLSKSPTPSNIRSATLMLPEGLTINPDAADGQSACTNAQANFGTEGPAECPDNSKIGTFDIGSPALEAPLVGSLYFGEPRPGNQYRVFMIADGFGIHAKLVANVHPDPVTGQLTITTQQLPQVPFEEFNLHLFASQRGMLATPTQCTIYQASSLFVPWNSTLSPQTSTPSFGLDSGPRDTPCPGSQRPFRPRLVAGMSTPVAGAFSNFHLKLDRDDGDQFLGDLNFKFPPGFTGSLRGISYCPEGSISAAAQQAGRVEQTAPSCPASSQIGTTNVSAGPGSHPFHAIGKMYLAGPFKGAPLSLAAVTPALAGPYDYGTVVVRVALHVDPLTAQVTAVSDKVPSIIGGVPIRMRSIQVNIDRPNFTINPTNCSPFSIDSQGIGDQGAIVDFSSYFHAVNCRALPFKPKLTIRQLGGRNDTRRSRNPKLQIDLTTRTGDANIKSLAVTLPNAFEIDQRHLGNICSEKELSASECAGRTQIGKASTTTPLLDQPLSGPVYAVSGSGGLPRLAFILNGQVDLVPRADTETVKGGRLQTTVPVVPDAPIGHFHLIVFGGKHGYLINTRDLCVRRPAIRIDYAGQNGKTFSQNIKVRTCGKSKARAKRHRR
jgi:hypothetical protein